MKTTIVSITVPLIPGIASAEELIVYCARVSNPKNQLNTATAEKLLKYCISHGHWSIFEQASMTVEVETSRAIAAQILRHKSFAFQEFSQRYASVDQLGDELLEPFQLRARHEEGNRQGSGKEIGDTKINHDAYTILERAVGVVRAAEEAYHELIENGVAPECARMVLPLCTKTRLYMTGNVRSWLHYFQQRCSEHTQKEHRELATSIRDNVFAPCFPVIHRLITTP